MSKVTARALTTPRLLEGHAAVRPSGFCPGRPSTGRTAVSVSPCAQAGTEKELSVPDEVCFAKENHDDKR